MARPREFDLDRTLEKAMNVFWNKGYEGASLNDLLEEMQIARGSLYKAFGDKRRLFIETLKYYDKTCITAAVHLLKDETIPEGGQRIARLMESIALAVEIEGDRRGCFLCNSVVDQAPHDTEIEGECQRMMRRMESGFFVALRASDQFHDLNEKDLMENARNLNVTYNGLRVMAKAGYRAEDILTAIHTALRETKIT
ncbi:TetR/AcrR family transcriptional regulator [Kiloniella antarctica]|uniref:TetR/AcrR family transcriptional regulator n=1 Tax=Kiloniella antarctica TaxID=1550907 RepID=A0ABW5BNY3_9PROT